MDRGLTTAGDLGNSINDLEKRLEMTNALRQNMQRQRATIWMSRARLRNIHPEERWSDKTKFVVLTLALQQDSDERIALAYLATKVRLVVAERRHDETYLCGLLSAWKRNHGQSFLQEYASKNQSLSRSWTSSANKFAAEWQTAQWLYVQNVSKGFAPNSAQIATQIDDHRNTPNQTRAPADPMPHVMLADPTATMNDKDRATVCRWRKAWRVSIARIRTREELTSQEITNKAAKRSHFRDQKMGPVSVANQIKRGSKSSPKFGTGF